MPPTPPPADGIAVALARGCAQASEALARRVPGDWIVVPVAHAVCRLAEHPEHGLSSDAEVLAAVVLPLRGLRPACAVLALEPKAALRLVCEGAAEAPTGPRAVAAYVEAAGELAQTLAAALLPDAEPSAPDLVEGALPAVLAGTHAPRETLVLSALLQLVRDEGEPLSAFVCLLVDGKDLTLASALPELRPEA